MGIYKAYTDVSIKNGKAFHSYCLFDQKDNFIKGKVFRSDVKGSTQGEEYSIQTLIMDLKKERIENVKIYTDHLGMRMQKETRRESGNWRRSFQNGKKDLMDRRMNRKVRSGSRNWRKNYGTMKYFSGIMKMRKRTIFS